MKKKSIDIVAFQASIRNKSMRYQGIHRFRASVDLKQFVSCYKKLFPFKGSLQDFYGAPFPKSPKQIFGVKTPKQRVTAIREILWAISRSLQFASELRDFVEAHNNYQVALLRSDFDSAIFQLGLIEKKFGKSIWLYQNLMASAYASPSGSEPADAATLVLEEVKPNSVLHALLHYARRRIEGATLREKLRAEVVDNLGQSGYETYFLAKIIDATDSSELAVSSLLYFDAQASLIDHYTSLILALQNAVSAEVFDSATTSLIKGPLKQLFNLIGDRRLVGVLAALGDLRDVESGISASDRSRSIEAYTAGDYSQCITLANQVLSADPLDIAIRVLSCKAIVAIEGHPERVGGGLWGNP